MGIIQKQGIKSSYYIFIGFLIGAINLLVLFPMFFNKNDQGLVRAMIDIGATLSVFCTLGTLPVVYKFFPFYNHYLGKEKNELPFLTLIINLIGFGILLIIGLASAMLERIGPSASPVEATRSGEAAKPVETKNEPLAELGVAPGAAAPADEGSAPKK